MAPSLVKTSVLQLPESSYKMLLKVQGRVFLPVHMLAHVDSPMPRVGPKALPGINRGKSNLGVRELHVCVCVILGKRTSSVATVEKLCVHMLNGLKVKEKDAYNQYVSITYMLLAHVCVL